MPPWYDLECSDLGAFMKVAPLDHGGIRTILDVGCGFGLRTMLALGMNPLLNRPDVHVSGLDLASHAVVHGVLLWEDVLAGDVVLLEDGEPLPPPRYSMGFRRESAAALPEDVRRTRPDLLIDWMMLHGMEPASRDAYIGAVMEMRPRYILLNCFTLEHGTLRGLPPSVRGVEKTQFTDADVESIFGALYDVRGPKMDTAEQRNPEGHSDGAIAAKRAYCLVRRD